ncbi:MAG TPA: hypothetical protein DCM64_02905 [Gammaproteobacteria bacterium]|nr:hypothetical protein [Gammaproteobacteria bacterium]MDP6732073.1 hypothetical protein [Gammaproteobacteria bacterium]HAJ75383.1 hypothetical protein [Gammaproteobacteria bacterium]
MMLKKFILFMSLSLLLVAQPASLQDDDPAQPLLTVRQIMDAIVTPMTTTIWGAYQLQTDAEWLEIEHAALAVIAAGNLMASGGAGDGEQTVANEADWQTYNNQMISAARAVITAVEQKDEEALFAAGNDALYPPCESCHQQYQQQ